MEPTLTPWRWTPTRPFPLIANLAICLAVGVQSNDGGEVEQALVVVPKLNRLINLGDERKRMALLEDVIEYFRAIYSRVIALSAAPSSGLPAMLPSISRMKAAATSCTI